VWDMTSNCWQEDPSHRPAAAGVVEFLREWPVVSLSLQSQHPETISAATPYMPRIWRCPLCLHGDGWEAQMTQLTQRATYLYSRRPQKESQLRPDRWRPRITLANQTLSLMRPRRSRVHLLFPMAQAAHPMSRCPMNPATSLTPGLLMVVYCLLPITGCTRPTLITRVQFQCHIFPQRSRSLRL